MNKEIKSIQVDNVTYWIDTSFKDSSKLVKGNGILFTRDSGDREVFYYDEHDGYGLGVFDLSKQRCTIRGSACCLIVAQSELKLEGIPVRSLDETGEF